MIQILGENPLLLLFVVAAIGYLVGSIKIKGGSLGVAAVLFVGLAFGGLGTEMKAPEILFQLGLVFFVYSIGLSSGPAFFKSFKQNGARDISFVLLMLTLSGLLAIGIHFLIGFDPLTTTGIYTGSTTNTPALAGVIDQVIQNQSGDASELIQDAVVAYSFTYPMGVMASIISIILMEKWLKINYADEKKSLRKEFPFESNLTSKSVLITNPAIADRQVRDILNEKDWNIVFGRHFRDGQSTLTNYDTYLKLNDEVMVVGAEHELENIIPELGKLSEVSLEHDRQKYDVRRIFVSNHKLVGRPLSSLDLDKRFNAVVTRIRRGDTDMLATGRTILELGDRVRFVARRKDLRALSKYFGDSYFESSKANLFSFGLGIALGLLLGMVTFTLPGNISFKLGFAGGPLIIGLILGSLYRTGPIVWTLPYSTNVTLRQIGLIILLAVIGIRSGPAFWSSLKGGSGMMVFLGGSIISLLTAIFTLWIGYRLIRIPFSLLIGFVSNQPAILEFALNRSKNRIPLVGYSLMFPIALITKIIYAQILYLLLS